MADNLITIVASLRRIQTEGVVIPSNAAIFTADPVKNYYIQFAAGRDNTPEPRDGTYLYAEAVGNEYLERKFALGRDQLMRLQALGWNLPDSSGNYWRTYQAADDRERQWIAQDVIQTFAEVYGLPADHMITVEVQID